MNFVTLRGEKNVKDPWCDYGCSRRLSKYRSKNSKEELNHESCVLNVCSKILLWTIFDEKFSSINYIVYNDFICMFGAGYGLRVFTGLQAHPTKLTHIQSPYLPLFVHIIVAITGLLLLLSLRFAVLNIIIGRSVLYMYNIYTKTFFKCLCSVDSFANVIEMYFRLDAKVFAKRR